MSTIHDAVPMIKFGDGLLVPVDRLPPELRRRWDMAQSRLENGEDVRAVIRSMVDEAKALLGPELLLRAAHRAGPASILDLGIAAQQEADEEERKEGGKNDAKGTGDTRTLRPAIPRGPRRLE